MLIRRHDAAQDDDEWRSFLAVHDFGELIASGRGHDVPIVVPTHFIFDGALEITLHLAKPNPVWERLEQNPLAIVSVFDAYTYIPTGWNADAPVPPEEGVPTSYYAAVQAVCRFEIVDTAAGLADILTRQLAHFQASEWGSSGAGQALAGRTFPERWTEMLPGIRGLRGQIIDVRAKFKFGGNKPREHRARIADQLDARGGSRDAAARDHLLRRMAAS